MRPRELPSVEQLLQTASSAELISKFGRRLTLEGIRTTLQNIRQRIPSIEIGPTTEEILSNAERLIVSWSSPSLVPVINATGVILHTNLGRAPLSKATIRAMERISQGYNNLEFNLEDGKRGSRLVHAEGILRLITGAEAALVVNNNAAAILLILSALAVKKRIIISRTQMIEIGDGFRIPDVMKQSGAKLVEVGTTNQVHLSDYESALSEPAALVIHAHQSNFRILGYTSEPGKKEIIKQAHLHGALFMDDLGSGCLLATERFGLVHEPTIQESLEAGSDLVCFSGDKLLGGPQAGIILGTADVVGRIKKHPLARAVRVDKLCLSALSATLLHYLKGVAEKEIPVWQMISISAEQLKSRVENWVKELGQGQVIASQSTIGGGSMPGETLPTFALAINVKNINKVQARLRQTVPAIIARTENNQILFDPRTIYPDQDRSFLELVKSVLQQDYF
jgi:L-seryl-tRNA(Ser) seleniumtransferase